MRVTLLLSLILFLLSPLQAQGDSELGLIINPPMVATKWDILHYRITLPANTKGHALCTGWVYPVLQWYIDQWPYRDSCVILDGTRRIVDVYWGGPHYPLPYPGEYRGHAYLFDPKTRTSREVKANFMVVYELHR